MAFILLVKSGNSCWKVGDGLEKSVSGTDAIPVTSVRAMSDTRGGRVVRWCWVNF